MVGPAPASSATQSWWLTHAGPMPTASKRPPDYTDIAIIGAGMTGCATAYYLQKLFGKGAAGVAVLDARGCAGGATGRNGGHLWANPASDFERNTCADMIEFLETNSVACDFTRDGATALDRRSPAVGIVYNDRADDPESKDDNEDWGEDFVEWDAATCEARLQTDSFSTGVHFPDACQFYPAKVAAALLQRAGCTYCAPVRVLSVRAGQGSDAEWQLLRWSGVESDGDDDDERGRGGVLRARRVVVAANGWAAELLPELSEHLYPTRNSVIMTKPLPRTAHWGVGAFSVDSENGARELYAIRRPDGRVCLGGARALEAGAAVGVADDTTRSEVVGQYLRRFLTEHFPRLVPVSSAADGEEGNEHADEDECGLVEAEWTGVLGFTADGKPLVGALPARPNVFVGAGFCGHGMPQCFGVAKGLALMLEGRGDEAHPFLRNEANVARVFKE
jgi:glycine/D-amino acid oxidase-like deaminating enzyme